MLKCAFAGACNSGKTTLISKLRTRLNAVVVDDPIRAYLTNWSIDEARSNPDNYFDLQQKAIKEKLERELSVTFLNQGYHILIDRTLADSLYYLLFYVRPDKLSQTINYFKLVTDLTDYVMNRARYDLVVLCRPRPVLAPNPARPYDLHVRQEAEFEAISYLVKKMTLVKKLMVVDTTDPNCVDTVYDTITYAKTPCAAAGPK